MECTETQAGRTIIVLCNVSFDEDREEFLFSLRAKLFDGNSYEELKPPADGTGGVHG